MDTRSSLEAERRRDEVNRLLAEATLMRLRGEWRKALERCHAALVLDPASPFVLEAQGDLLSDLGEHDAALESYRSALRALPDRKELEEKVGLAALRLSDKQELSHAQEELAGEAEVLWRKRKTVPGAVVWSAFLPGGGHIYLGDHSRGAVILLVFLGLLLYITSVLLEVVARSANPEAGLLGGLWLGLRSAAPATRVGFSLAVAGLVAVYVFNLLDTLRKARGTLLLSFLSELPASVGPVSPGEGAGDSNNPAGRNERGGTSAG